MSLAELPELVGFFSYAREDDIGSGGRLTRLRERIHEELRSQLGRRRSSFRVWQDKMAIPEGALWNDEIRIAVDQSVFFVPIITPTAVKSEYCKAEFEHFLAREKELGRNDLVFPILYIRVPELENEDQWRQNPVLKIVGERQYLDWLSLRHLDMDSKETGVAIERFCRSIHDALCRPWVSPNERRKQEEGARRLKEEQDAQQRQAEDARRKRKADELRAEDEGARKVVPEIRSDRKAQVKNPKGDAAPIAASRSEEISEQGLQNVIAGHRTTALVVSSIIGVLAVICYFVYAAIVNFSFFSIGGFVGWVVIIGCFLPMMFCLMGLAFEVAAYREAKARLRQLQRSTH